MRAPLAGKREAARRLAEEMRRRLEPLERAVPIRLPGGPPDRSGPAEELARDGSPAAPDGSRAAPEHDLAARIDAARERLRATIQPRDDRGEGT